MDIENINKRSDQTKHNDKVQDFNIGLYQIDASVKYHIENNIKPKVIDNGTNIDVPIIYSSPEKWKSVKKDSFYRDKKNKNQIIIPLILFSKTSIDQNNDLGRHLDANQPNIFVTYKSKYSKYNQYDRFSKLYNQNKVPEFHNVIVPNYVNINYECQMWTYQVSQMNKLIEQFLFANRSYWGEEKKYQFHVSISGFNKTIEVNEGDDRGVKTTFSLSLKGYIVSDNLQKQLSEFNQKSFGISKIIMSENNQL